MGPQEQILTEFFRTLGELPEFPLETLDRLKELFGEELTPTKDQIRDAIARGTPHDEQGEAD